MRGKIVIVGGGGHAKVIISILKKIKKYEIVGFTDSEKKQSILGIQYLGSDKILNELFQDGVKRAAIGLGQIKLSENRKNIVNNLLNIGFEFPTVISPNAIVNEDVEIGKGTIVMDGVVINCGTRIGEYSIINTNSSIDHDCKIGNYVHIAPGVTLSGEVSIDNNILLGTGVSIIQSIIIEKDIIVGAGSVVVNDLLESGTYVGCPARKIK